MADNRDPLHPQQAGAGAGTGRKSAIKPLADAAQKAAKAGKIKAIKLKIKFRDSKKNPATDLSG